MEGITDVEKLKIPQCLSIEPRIKRPISDASESVFGAVAHMRSKHDACARRYFILSKSRIASLKRVRLPHIQMQASELSVKLMRQIMEEIRLEHMTEIYF